MKFVIIAGRMRSGTSALGEVCHMMGCPMGTWFTAPEPPTWRSDWEDKDLNDIVFKRTPFGTPASTNIDPKFVYDDFMPYFERRARRVREVAHVTGYRYPAIGVKQPFLTFFLPQFVKAAADCGFAPITIFSRRPDWQVEASMEKTVGLKSGGRASQKGLEEAMGFWEPDLWVDYDELLSNPNDTVRMIAKRIGVKGEEDIQRGIAAVKQPTSHEAATAGF